MDNMEQLGEIAGKMHFYCANSLLGDALSEGRVNKLVILNYLINKLFSQIVSN